MNINLNDLLYLVFGIVSAYFTFKLNSKKSDRDYIMEQNKRLNNENKELAKENKILNERLREEINDEAKH
ncbi:hypothetical protein EFS28_10815 [Lactobacillus acidophilus]|uniref:hypothetical protein n=1 Tax=Lactobacillus acidophilus TaxID=1579 RepID=UPI0021A864D8|nr:hypothetical protein [Lactobacillus acidophilus]MCT3603218.1 hypothetical protein [Lactobacillus acidophilus]MCT3624665.1 hypothetical protein [Lactobacillus acidophilus]